MRLPRHWKWLLAASAGVIVLVAGTVYLSTPDDEGEEEETGDDKSVSVEDAFPGKVVDAASGAVPGMSDEPLWEYEGGEDDRVALYRDLMILSEPGSGYPEDLTVLEADTGEEVWSQSSDDPLPDSGGASLSGRPGGLTVVEDPEGDAVIPTKYAVDNCDDDSGLCHESDVETAVEYGVVGLSVETGEPMWSNPVVPADPIEDDRKEWLRSIITAGDVLVAVVEVGDDSPLHDGDAHPPQGESEDAFDHLRVTAVDGVTGETLWEDTGLWPAAGGDGELLSYRMGPDPDPDGDDATGNFVPNLVEIDPESGEERVDLSERYPGQEMVTATNGHVVFNETETDEYGNQFPQQSRVVDVDTGESVVEIDYPASRCVDGDELLACVVDVPGDVDYDIERQYRLWTYDFETAEFGLGAELLDPDHRFISSVWDGHFPAGGAGEPDSVLLSSSGEVADTVPGNVRSVNDEYVVIDTADSSDAVHLEIYAVEPG